MKTNHPMRGLLIFSFHAASGNASLVLLASIALAVIYLITGNQFFFSMMPLVGLLMFPMMVIASLASKDGKWERFQLTMPIRRGGLLGMQYLSVLGALIIAIALVVVTIALSIFLGNGALHGHDFVTGLRNIMLVLAMPFLMSGLCFPLASTRFGQDKGPAILTFCQFVAIGIILVAPWTSEQLGVSLHMIGALFLAASALLFIISYFITRMLYAKMDF